MKTEYSSFEEYYNEVLEKSYRFLSSETTKEGIEEYVRANTRFLREQYEDGKDFDYVGFCPSATASTLFMCYPDILDE